MFNTHKAFKQVQNLYYSPFFSVMIYYFRHIALAFVVVYLIIALMLNIIGMVVDINNPYDSMPYAQNQSSEYTPFEDRAVLDYFPSRP